MSSKSLSYIKNYLVKSLCSYMSIAWLTFTPLFHFLKWDLFVQDISASKLWSHKDNNIYRQI